MTKIEEVARAIGGNVWESCSDRMKEQIRAQARAAIEAMRGTTPEIVEAYCAAPSNAQATWDAMISAALAEGPLSPQSTG